MNWMNRRQVLQMAIATLAALSLGQVHSNLFAATAPRKLAVLIGINDYSNTSLNPLRGAITDVEMQEHLLRERYGFQDGDILTLTDAEATREGILTAIAQHLVEQAQPGDVVVLHYSGHAMEISDPTCEDEDCRMGVLLPANSDIQLDPSEREPSQIPENSITRADLEVLLSQLDTEQVTVVIDASAATRFARSEGFVKGVLLAGTGPDQLAADISIEPGDHAGAFTYALTQHLWQQAEDETLAESMGVIRENTQALSERMNLLQTPTFITEPDQEYGQEPIYFLQ